jgi:F0F1-type ATP synthase assembly protein I
MKRDDDDNAWALIGRYSGMGFILPVSAVTGFVIGWLLDKLFHTHFLYIVFLVLGIVGGFVELLRKLQADTRADGG